VARVALRLCVSVVIFTLLPAGFLFPVLGRSPGSRVEALARLPHHIGKWHKGPQLSAYSRGGGFSLGQPAYTEFPVRLHTQRLSAVRAPSPVIYAFQAAKSKVDLRRNAAQNRAAVGFPYGPLRVCRVLRSERH
jgi:hypothetical protein